MEFKLPCSHESLCYEVINDFTTNVDDCVNYEQIFTVDVKLSTPSCIKVSSHQRKTKKIKEDQRIASKHQRNFSL